MITLTFKQNNNTINLKANVCKNTILANYMDFKYFTGLCKEGCPHYNLNYTCPPNSPKFTECTKDYKYSLVLALYMNIEKNHSLEETHSYLRKILSSILIPLEKEFCGLLTDGGRCQYCEKCTYIDNLPCRYTDKIRFSMEAMGLDLDKVCKDILNHNIMWDKKNENIYCTVLGSINFNKDISENNFKNAISRLLK